MIMSVRSVEVVDYCNTGVCCVFWFGHTVFCGICLDSTACTIYLHFHKVSAWTFVNYVDNAYNHVTNKFILFEMGFTLSDPHRLLKPVSETRQTVFGSQVNFFSLFF